MADYNYMKSICKYSRVLFIMKFAKCDEVENGSEQKWKLGS